MNLWYTVMLTLVGSHYVELSFDNGRNIEKFKNKLGFAYIQPLATHDKKKVTVYEGCKELIICYFDNCKIFCKIFYDSN